MRYKGFVRKVHKGILQIGKKYAHDIGKDSRSTTRKRHIERKFIRDYLHSYTWDRENQQFTASDIPLVTFSHVPYRDTPTCTELQWLAGLTEHMSCVRVQYTQKNTRFHPIIRLFYVTSCLPLIQYINHWYKVKIIQYASGHWGICLSSDKAISLLEAILPYCVLRKELYTQLISYFYEYKNNTKLFPEHNSFKEYTAHAHLLHAIPFSYEPWHYIGGFYDAKGNVTFQYDKNAPFKAQLHLYCQTLGFLENVQEYFPPGLLLRYTVRDNCHNLSTAMFRPIMEFLPRITPYTIYKRTYTELLEDWLPVFYNAKSKHYYRIATAVKMYWLFFQYGIELHSKNALFS